MDKKGPRKETTARLKNLDHYKVLQHSINIRKRMTVFLFKALSSFHCLSHKIPCNANVKNPVLRGFRSVGKNSR